MGAGGASAYCLVLTSNYYYNFIKYFRLVDCGHTFFFIINNPGAGFIKPGTGYIPG